MLDTMSPPTATGSEVLPIRASPRGILSFSVRQAFDYMAQALQLAEDLQGEQSALYQDLVPRVREIYQKAQKREQEERYGY
jgi:hypothetical protein